MTDVDPLILAFELANALLFRGEWQANAALALELIVIPLEPAANSAVNKIQLLAYLADRHTLFFDHLNDL